MDDGYLPDYYIRKKQRDRMYTNVWKAVCGLVVVIAAVIVGNFLFNSWGITLKNRGKPAVNAEHADELNNLQTEKRISDAIASQNSVVGDPGESQAVDSTMPVSQDPATALPSQNTGTTVADLSKIDYSESFPLVTVSLESGGKTAAGEDQSGTSRPAPITEESKPATTDSTKVQTDKDKPAEIPEEQPVEKPAKPVLSNKVYHIYVAEVRTREEAESINSKLAEHGYQGQIVEQKPNFLVKVMETSRSEEALALVEKLRELGFDPITTRSNK